MSSGHLLSLCSFLSIRFNFSYGLVDLSLFLGLFNSSSNHFLFVFTFIAALGFHLSLNTAHVSSLCLHLSHSFLVHLNIFVNHHFLEEYEIFHRQNLLQYTLVDASLRFRLSQYKVLLRYTQILDISLKFRLNHALKLVVDHSVFQSILVRVFEYQTLFLDKVYDGILPNGRLKELGNNLEDPFLEKSIQLW